MLNQTAELILDGTNSLIYRQDENDFGKPVIIKVLKTEHPTKRQITQFTNEIELTRSIKSSGIRKGLLATTVGNNHALVLDFVDGQTLQTFFTAQPRSLVDFLQIAIGVAHNLQNVHDHQIIHKDINSSNILVDSKTLATTIIDFGIASTLDLKMDTFSNPEHLEGTLAYISPEQTGRMNRSVDYRTDLYSLGVTFYELLAGHLPFEMIEPLALVHAHLAINPLPVSSTSPKIPTVLSDIVMKLMAKNAEARYQSAAGLIEDLQICQRQLETTGAIEPFALAAQDFSAQFKLPQKLYGREAERQTLLDAFERSLTKGSQVVMVSGYSGIGKSALINEIHKPVTERNGYFISGKFEQYQRDIPFSGLVGAIQELVRYLLSEPDEKLAGWRVQILDAIGTDSQVLLELVPELELIVGKQQSSKTLDAQASQNRLHFLFTKLIEVFARKEHPLVLVLDDLQWADIATVTLLQQIILGDPNRSLLLIGAYRYNEVDALHPLQKMMDDLDGKSGSFDENFKIRYLTLDVLLLANVEALLGDLLHPDEKQRREEIPLLAVRVHTRTSGNPFFVREFLKSLYDAELIKPDHHQKKWVWFLPQIDALPSTESVVELLINQMRQLPADTQSLLRLAACIGNRFSLAVLTSVVEATPRTIEQHLWPALNAGMIVPLNGNGRYFNQSDPVVAAQSTLTNSQSLSELPFDSEDDVDLWADSEEILYKFVHDRVQQAAYSLIAPSDRADMHLEVGRLMLQNFTPEQQNENLFELIGHFNTALSLGYQSFGKRSVQKSDSSEGIHPKPGSTNTSSIEHSDSKPTAPDAEELTRVAQLNLLAGKKAISAAAFHPALRYLHIGWEITSRSGPESAWRDQYETALEFHNLLIKAAYVAGDLDIMHGFMDDVVANATNIWDKMPSAVTKLEYYLTSNQYREGILWGRKMLQPLGIELPKRPSNQYILGQILRTDWRLRNAVVSNRFNPFSPRKYNKLLSLPPLEDQQKLAIMTMIRPMMTLTFFAEPRLFSVLTCTVLNLTLKHGYSPESVTAYDIFGIALSSTFNRANDGYKLGQIALNLAEKLQLKQSIGEARLYAHGFLNHWKEPVRQNIPQLPMASQICLEAGDIRAAASTVSLYCQSLYNWGYPLAEVKQEHEKYRLFLENNQQETFSTYMAPYQQSVLNLLGEAEDPCQLVGSAYNETETKAQRKAEKGRATSLILHRRKSELFYLHGRLDEALDNVRVAEQYLGANNGLIENPLVFFYGSMIRLALCFSVNQKTRRQFLRKVVPNIKKLKKVAKNAPANFEHCVILVEAELAWVRGQHRVAREYYERAAALCREQEYLHHEALAFERAALFADATGQKWLAQTYLRESYNAYQQWGAITKLRDLEVRFPHLLAIRMPNARVPGALSTISHSANHYGTRDLLSPVTRETTGVFNSTAMLDSLDLTTILRASQTISGEIVIEKLLAKMMKVVAESAGAQRAVLLLQWHNRWLVQADLDQRDLSQVAIDYENTAEENIANENGDQEELARQNLSKKLMQAIPLPDAATTVPVGLISFAIRTTETIILDDGSEDIRFQNEPYFKQSQPKSLLCMPLINQGKIMGMLYLENYLNAGVFAPDRIELLTLLSSQMAISLNNAFTYEHLEEMVTARTSDLKDAQEQAEQASLSKSTFLSQMTHELRTPMNGVLGMTTLLSDTALTNEQLDMLNTIRSSGDTLLTIINDILDFSKIEANKLELEQVPFDIASCIEETFDLVRPSASVKGLALTHHITDNVPSGVTQDVTRVRQILTNLVGNAIKFTDNGSIHVLVSASRLTEENEKSSHKNKEDEDIYRLHFAIKDTGIGIPADRLENLFDSFSQVDASTTRKYGGTGLGLTISKQLCELMGGQMWVESVLNEGSTFNFTIVAKKADIAKAQHARRIADFDATMAQNNPLRILLAEDNVVNQKVALGVLKKCGYSADVAANGLEAIDALTRQPYDLILMDIHMPEMDGVTATKRIRAEWPQDQQPTIIALTADAMEQQRDMYLASGMDNFVSKPIRISELVDALSRVHTRATSC